MKELQTSVNCSYSNHLIEQIFHVYFVINNTYV